MLAKRELAELHHQRASILYHGWRPWRRLVALRRQMNAEADTHFAFCFAFTHFWSWVNATERRQTRRFSLGQAPKWAWKRWPRFSRIADV
eukprot:TRINITY_DN4432_c0_g1_i1.p3 TRINITY_DN4432_c0_g1~~TRINITY_DN4432_c0_g1_i1.p3  ORF type:complete len:90 (+),score=9.73 TRINITY_DN4432_c0_g1_i1:76-345(+)